MASVLACITASKFRWGRWRAKEGYIYNYICPQIWSLGKWWWKLWGILFSDKSMKWCVVFLDVDVDQIGYIIEMSWCFVCCGWLVVCNFAPAVYSQRLRWLQLWASIHHYPPLLTWRFPVAAGKSLALAVQGVSEDGTSASSPIATFVAAAAASAWLGLNGVLWVQWGLVNVPSGVQSKSNTAC
jgi:hypothetical protein